MNLAKYITQIVNVFKEFWLKRISKSTSIFHELFNSQEMPVPLNNDNQKEYNPENGVFISKELLKRIPLADTVIDYIDNLEQRKNNELINELNSKIEKLKLSYKEINEKINTDKEFKNIFDYTIIKAKQCNRHKQIEILIYLLAYYIHNPNIPGSDMEIVIDIIISLNVKEEEFFFTILEKSNFNFKSNESIFLNSFLKEEEKPIYISLKNRLISKGIIYDRPTELVGENLMMSNEFEVRFTHYGKILAMILSKYYLPRLN